LLQHKDIERFLEENKISLRNQVQVSELVFIAGFYFLVVAVMAAGVAMLVYAGIGIHVGLAGSRSISEGDLNAVDFFILNSDARDAFIVVDKEIEEITDKTIDVIKIVEPNFFDTVSEIEVRNLVKINVVNHLN